MNSLLLSSSLCLSPSSISQFPPYRQTQPHNLHTNHHNQQCYHLHYPSLAHPFISHKSLQIRRSIGETISPIEGAIPVMEFEDFVEKDWSFLDSDDLISSQDYNHKLNRIISSGEIENSSRVMVSAAAEGFVDQLVESSPCNLLLVVHDSLFVLAGIKEKYDKVKCWQGELIYVPEKWAPLDVVFLYCLPAIPFTFDQVLAAVGKHCSPGARLVISHPQGRGGLEQQRKQYSDVIVSDLPEKPALQEAASNHFFDLVEFVDDPGFYLAVLKLNNAG
ncbi:hypothetical protein CsatB_019562 [Cannabis sativa]